MQLLVKKDRFAVYYRSTRQLSMARCTYGCAKECNIVECCVGGEIAARRSPVRVMLCILIDRAQKLALSYALRSVAFTKSSKRVLGLPTRGWSKIRSNLSEISVTQFCLQSATRGHQLSFIDSRSASEQECVLANFLAL